MLTITLVRVGGFLVGRSVSDRWNLEAIGVGPIRADRNQADVKRLRRITAGEFVIVVARGGVVQERPTDAERDALGIGPGDALPRSLMGPTMLAIVARKDSGYIA